jgi:hypothetical protein
MKLPVSKLVLAGILIAGILVSSVKAQPGANRPPGVPIENWIAISDSAGIVIRDLPRTPTRYRFDPNQPGVPIPVPPDANAIPLGVQSLPGVLVAKHEGLWIRIDMPMPPAQVQPLHH